MILSLLKHDTQLQKRASGVAWVKKCFGGGVTLLDSGGVTPQEAVCLVNILTVVY